MVRQRERGADLAAAGAELVDGNVADPNLVAEAAEGCDVLYHCAGESSHRASHKALSWINVAGTENVIKAAKHVGVRRVVLLSCADVTLRNADRHNWKEDRFLNGLPLGAHARTRLLAEELARNMAGGSTSVAAIRPGWIWGPGDHSTLPGLCQEGLAGGIRLHGRGDNLVATIYIDNLVDALLAAAHAAEVPSGVYHVNDEEDVTANEFFSMLSAALGLPQPKGGSYWLSYGLAWLAERMDRPGMRPSEVARRGRGCLLDCVKAAHELDYRPAHTHEEGAEALKLWAREQGGPSAIAALSRSPATDKDVRFHMGVADAD